VARLARVVVNPDAVAAQLQDRERDTDFRDTVVTLLIDNSGSMRGRPISDRGDVLRIFWRARSNAAR
jgi:cobalamin biosynthesis protein CobT